MSTFSTAEALGLPMDLAPSLPSSSSLARVTAVHRGAVDVARVDALAGRVPCARPVTVGDFVVEDGGRVTEVLARRTVLSRAIDGAHAQVLAANIDDVLCVVAADQRVTPRRLERAAALAWDAGAVPVVVVTKVDVCEDLDALLGALGPAAMGLEVFATSAATGAGLEALAQRLATPISACGAARTAVLLGLSGAGKSALTNALRGDESLATGAVRDDGRGRHTTTGRALLPLPAGGLLIDVPGLRTFGLAVDDDALARTFPDVEAFAEACRFRDCGHRGEPGCAVQAAIDDGALDASRLESLHALEREAAHARTRIDPRAAQAEKHRVTKMTVMGWERSRAKRS